MLRKNQKLGKYRITGRLARSRYASVYEGFDTIQGMRVALKLPDAKFADKQFLEEFRKEVRLAGRLEHENILPIKDASFIDGHFVIAMPLGERTLADRLAKRIALDRAMDFAEQMISAVAHAHSRRVIHCDIKPENFILFPGGQLKLADFGISKVALRTLKASGSGTLGYVAPEQAMGWPSFRSDVFSLGLIVYRMLAGELADWPFDWPPPGYERLRKRVSPGFIAFLRKAMELKPERRYKDAQQMLAAFKREKPHATQRRERRKPRRNGNGNGLRWREVRFKEFKRQYGRILETHMHCRHCDGPVSEKMQNCPWCGKDGQFFEGQSRFPASCSRCKRGTKLDWRFCAWCYGTGFADVAKRSYADKHYSAKCHKCRKLLMPFMRYCPWCRAKVKRKWAIPSVRHRCSSCGWGVVKEFWTYCPWCKRRQGRHAH